MNHQVCEFIKKNRERCKHSTAVGQHLCWQHAKGFRSKLRSLPKNARLLFAISILSFGLTAYGVWLALFSPTKSSVSNVETFGDQSPVVQDNKGSVELNEQQSNQSKKKSDLHKQPNQAEGDK